MIEPLRKQTSEGKRYIRRPEIESKIIELSMLPRQELITRCKITKRSDPAHVPSECLMYFVRACRNDNSDVLFNQLYTSLAERVRCFSMRNSGQTTSTESMIREKVFDQFVNLLAHDRTEYMDKLDYYEVSFENVMKRRYLDAQKQVWRDEKRAVAFYNEETGEPTVAVERSTGSFDLFNSSAWADADYRSRLWETIDSLPPEQRQIILMIDRGIPIDSKDPDAHTIAKTLGKSEKTIRTYRDKAYAVLRAALNEGEDV